MEGCSAVIDYKKEQVLHNASFYYSHISHICCLILCWEKYKKNNVNRNVISLARLITNFQKIGVGKEHKNLQQSLKIKQILTPIFHIIFNGIIWIF
jgi:hypothetical protein